MIPNERPVGDARDNTTVAPANSPDEAPMVSRQYTKSPAEEKIIRFGEYLCVWYKVALGHVLI
jgi:hypothetical protein